MKIHGLTTCVGDDYWNALERSRAAWEVNLSSAMIVTDREVDGWSGWMVIQTARFYEDGATFNKSGAINQVRKYLPLNSWHLFFDADICPPADLLDRLESHDPKPGNLYGARRIVNGKPYHDGELAGFFQMFHSSDERAKAPLAEFKHAGCYDSEFMFRWPPEKRIILPIDMAHQGEPGQNWWGVGNREAMAKMKLERKKRGGWQHERLQSEC